MSMINKSKGLIKAAMSIMQNNYPENLGKSQIINAGLVFAGAWKIIKVFLDERTVAKIALHRGNAQKDLLDEIDESQLISYLGGKNTAQLSEDWGVWNEYDFFDGHTSGAEVGVRRKDDPEGKIFTPAML